MKTGKHGGLQAPQGLTGTTQEERLSAHILEQQLASLAGTY